MTRTELLEKNEKLASIDAIITKRADRKVNRDAVYELVMENFGESATLEDIKDLLEYYDEITNDATMVGSKLYDSTLFEPIKELALAYKEELVDLNEKLDKSGKREQFFRRLAENRHANYTVARADVARYKEENNALREKNSELQELLDYVSLSDKQKAKRVISAEEKERKALAQAEESRKGAEKVLAMSKELEDAKGAVEGELADAKAANVEIKKQNQELKNQVSYVNKKNRRLKIWAGFATVAAVFGATYLVVDRIGAGHHEVPETVKYDIRALEFKSYQTAENNLGYVEHIYTLADAGLDKANTLLSSPEISATDERVVAALEDISALKTTIGELKQQNASEKAKISAEIAKMNADETYLPGANKALDAIDVASKSLDEAKKALEEVVEDVELAGKLVNETLTAENTTLKTEKAELEETVAELRAENQAIKQRSAELEAENAVLTVEVNRLAEENAALVASDYALFNYIYEQAQYEVSDWFVEDGKIITFAAIDDEHKAIALSEAGVAAYQSFVDVGVNAVTVTDYVQSYEDARNLAKYIVEEMAKAYTNEDAPTEVLPPEQNPEEVADEDDNGKTPTSEAGADTPGMPTPHTGEEQPAENPNEQGEEQNSNEPTSTEVSDSNEEEKEDEGGKWTWGED